MVKARSRQLGARLSKYDGSIGYLTRPIEWTSSLSLQFSSFYASDYRVRTSAWGFCSDWGEMQPPNHGGGVGRLSGDCDSRGEVPHVL